MLESETGSSRFNKIEARASASAYFAFLFFTMSYLVLARKYRPAIFDEVIGQEHITELLKKAITSGRLAHAFLLCGPRGIGKTTCARILAKCLNCQDGPTLTPCGECSTCKEITKGTSFDVLEIDGASNRGIDEIRTLRENVKFAPSYGQYKIYIIDEVHMLTTEAFNALLKTLEEPPAHVKFIFATTDPNKIPATIISRCQKYDFRRITFKATVEGLNQICKAEKFSVEQEALYAIAKASEGSFRDALSILDQISALSDRKIKGEDVYSMLGLVETELLFDLSLALREGDCTKALKTFDAIIEKGKDIKQLSKDLVEHFRNLMIIKVGGKSLGKLVDYPVVIKEMYLEQAEGFALEEILNALDAFIEAQEVSRITETLRTPLEIAFAKLTYREEPAVPARPAPPRGELAVPAAPQGEAGETHRFSPVGMLKNQKGQVNPSTPPEDRIPEDDEEQEREDEEVQETTGLMAEDASEMIDLEKIKRSWGALTYGVSRKKMSVATYLQEGAPVKFHEKRLTIAFARDLEFHKETLAEEANVRLVEDIFSEKLKTQILIAYKIMDDIMPPRHEEEEPHVKAVLNTFKGKIISKWHKD